MRLKRYDDTVIVDPSMEEVFETVEALRPDGDLFAILSLADEIYIQTHINENELFDLEYREGSKDRHYTARYPVDRETVAEAFGSFLEQDNIWRTLVEWRRDRTMLS